MATRKPRKQSTRGYHPEGEPEGYQPPRRTRKGPRAYWRRNPYPDNWPNVNARAPQPVPSDKIAWFDLDPWADPDFWRTK